LEGEGPATPRPASEPPRKRSPSNRRQQDEILSRTLQQKLRTANEDR
jgi:hypothetical protein